MKSMPLFTMLLLCLLSSNAQSQPFNAQSQPFQYVFGTEKYSVPAMPQPAKGVPFQDPQFNTTHVRVSDKLIDGYGRSFMTNIYSTVNIELAGGKHVLLGDYNFYLYEIETSKMIKKLNIIHDTYDKTEPEVRPDPNDPNIFYYMADTILYKYDIRDDSSTIVHDFKNEYPNAQWAQTETQGDPSEDGRYWAFQIERYDPPVIGIDNIVYDKQTDQIVGRFADKYPAENVRWISMSPSGDRVLVKFWNQNPSFCSRYGCDNGPLLTRLVSFNRDFTNPIGILGANGHADKAVTLDGRDVMLYQHTTNDWITMAYVKTGQEVKLIKIDFTQGSTGFHFSGNNYTRPGWGLVSTYGVTQDWQNKQLYMLELKENPRIWRLAHTRSQPNPNIKKDYWAEAFATISRSGTKVWWSANWGNYQNRLETYQVTLPETWWEELSGAAAPPAPPLLSSPADNATNVSTTPSLAWSSSGATSYRLQVSTSANFSTTMVDQSGLTSTSFQVSSLSNSTTYYWRVNATNAIGTSGWAPAWEFSTEGAGSAPAAPALSSPSDNATNISTAPNLVWNASSGATSYQLQVSAVADFSTTFVDQSGITSNTYQINGLLNNTTYYWRVKATNANGTSPYSTVWQFSTTAATLSAPALSSPADNATNLPMELNLVWNTVSGAVSYQVQVSMQPDFSGNLIGQIGITPTSFQVSGLANETTYFWRVNATNAGGTSPWSTVWQFTTEPLTSVETGSEIPSDFGLGQNYPNPFNPTTNIAFDLPKSEYVSLKVYTLLGVEVATLVSENLPAGKHTIKFDASRLSSGVFFYKLQTSSFVETRKMLLVR
ncbi:MAG: T9SS type A sorting domain-containing protein [Caldithrix sp.]|nr:MAG: T9SS type A sorting domain-containing protein [Caldithrix sp.]